MPVRERSFYDAACDECPWNRRSYLSEHAASLALDAHISEDCPASHPRKAQATRDWAASPPTQEEVNRSFRKPLGHPDYIPLSVLVANNADASEFPEDD